MDIRREEAMEMSDDETEPAEIKDTEESGIHANRASAEPSWELVLPSGAPSCLG